MHWAQRAVVGVVVGATCVLFASPMARPAIRFGLWSFGPSKVVKHSQNILAPGRALPDPNSPSEAAAWLQTGAANIVAGDLTADEALMMVEIAHQGAESEPQNAFWLQSLAVFQRALKNEDACQKAWRRAAGLLEWNDHQSERIRLLLSELAAESGKQMAWHYYTAASSRDDSMERAIYSLGVSLATGGPLRDRYDSMRNGVLLRSGARTQSGSRLGYQLVEISAIGRRVPPNDSRSAVYERFRFVSDLDRASMRDEATRARQELSDNEGWRAFVLSRQAHDDLQSYAEQAALAATIPGSLLLVSLVFGALRTGSVFVPWKPSLGRIVQQGSPVLGLLLGVGMYGWTELLWPSLFVTVAVSTLVLRPAHVMPGGPTRPSYPFVLLQSVMGFVTALLLTGAVCAYAPPMIAAGAEGRFSEALPVASAAAMIVAASVASTSAWAYQWRRCSAGVLRLGLGRFVGGGAIMGTVAALVLAPVCIVWDKSLAVEMEQMAANTPAYYLSKK